ncbi:MAG: FAD-dependent oxidoreductase, partial [Acidobacteria bacterium]|nr:FAD-dependent oxidoreductase [Acidobacteriota bacterium]
DFATDLAAHGYLEPDKVCVACSACTQIMRDGGRSGCVPRDGEVYEPIYKAGREEALDTILAQAATCRQCNDPSCVPACPARVDVPKFIGEIASRQFRKAYETIRESNALAAVCGYVCPAETLCESKCINRFYGEPVPIRHLQRWVSRRAIEEGWVSAPVPVPKLTGRRVAVIGAGPAGIAAAAELAAAGHSVTVIEKNAAAGGTAEATIPSDRLPAWVMQREADALLNARGRIERRTGVEFGASCTIEGLEKEGFDAVLIAAGLRASVRLPSTVRPASGVVSALDFLRQVNGRRPVGAAGRRLRRGSGLPEVVRGDACLAG